MVNISKKFDYLVYIGRMQPPTIAHLKTIKMALGLADNVIVLVGSAGEPRTIKNPFNFEERKSWIRRNVGGQQNLFIEPIYDFPYNDNKWVAGVQKAVKNIVGERDAKIGIIGYMKDYSSYYLAELFPMWTTVNVKPHFYKNGDIIHATDFRNAYLKNIAIYGGEKEGFVDVSEHIKLSIHEDIEYLFETDEEMMQLREEFKYIEEYKKSWGNSPYPPTFVTGDAVVVQNGHVLLVRRKHAPGKGLWALPGGFINNHERIKDGIIRELHEETMVKVPVEVLRRNIKHIHVFDNPDRDNRGRVITHAAYIDLGNFAKLPHVKGADDADKAQWVPFSELKREDFFADHIHIIDFFIGSL